MVWHITGKIPLSYHKEQLMPISVDKVYSILNNHLLPIWHQAIFHNNATPWLLNEAAVWKLLKLILDLAGKPCWFTWTGWDAPSTPGVDWAYTVISRS